MNAKIITYDTANGTGMLITTENEKKNFNINDWTDFDTLPEVGLLVDINDNGTISLQKKKVNLDEEKLEKLKNIRNKYINGSIANGWKLENENEDGFVIKEKVFNSGMFFLWFIGFSIAFGFFLGFIGIIIALVITLFTGLAYSTTTLKGIVNKEAFMIEISKDGNPYKQLSVDDAERKLATKKEIEKQKEAYWNRVKGLS